MRYVLSSHRNGLDVVPKELIADVEAVMGSVRARVERGAARAIRQELLNALTQRGWSSEVPIAIDSDITITSMKSRVGLCLQTGNVARTYADLLKLQTLFTNGAITSGIIIVPSSQAAPVIGSNLANSARLEKELTIFRDVVTLPLVLVSFE